MLLNHPDTTLKTAVPSSLYTEAEGLFLHAASYVCL